MIWPSWTSWLDWSLLYRLLSLQWYWPVGGLEWGLKVITSICWAKFISRIAWKLYVVSSNQGYITISLHPRTRKTLRLRKTITFLSLKIIVGIEIQASQVKLWVGFSRKIFIWIREANKTNLPILQQSAIMLLSSKKIRSKMIET